VSAAPSASHDHLAAPAAPDVAEILERLIEQSLVHPMSYQLAINCASVRLASLERPGRWTRMCAQTVPVVERPGR
jgi:hypothetical protein